ncbi:MAG: hypothetical protein EBU59_04805 [Planctomycetia bacterium]|nr:hypothetical protein [Planctomycetia bacterium]
MVTLDFVIPGFSKCGTTTLCELLCQHPRVAIPRKEPGYFAQHYSQGPRWYGDLYRGLAAGVLRGDASTTYSTKQYGDVASIRLASRFPKLKCIFIARHPLKRLESSYRQMHHMGHLFGVSAERDISATLRKLPNMIADTRYWELLNHYRRFFPDDQIHVLFLEDLARQPEVAVRQCFRFLGVDPDITLVDVRQRKNTGEAKEYDTATMRLIRRQRLLRGLWSRLTPGARSRLIRRFGLRRPFTKPIDWPAETIGLLREVLAEDSDRLLAYAGRPPDYWTWPVAA